MEYDPIKDRLYLLTKDSTILRDALFFVIGKLFLREAHVKRHLLSLSLPKTSNFLDAGCGLGQYSFWLAKKFPKSHIVGADVKQHFLDSGNFHARKKGLQNLKFVPKDLLTLEEKQLYDCILAVDIMEHIEDDVDVFKRFYNALKKGGYLVVHTPGAKEDSRITTVNPKYQVEEHVRAGYYPPELEEKLFTAGFQKVQLFPTYHPITGQWLWRLWQYVPLHIANLGWFGFFLLPFWFLLAYPLGIPLWLRDLYVPLKEGRGILAIAKKE
ncbi:MAG: class I SAM-dependent methyltransferase [bacterium]|nr:class I SAM-dependent methyltransferase [bacterium]